MKRFSKYKIPILAILTIITFVGITYLCGTPNAKADNIAYSDKIETIQASGLYINGSLFAVLATTEDLQQVLANYKEQIINLSKNKTISSMEFVEAVEIRQINVYPNELKTANDVLNDLLVGKSSAFNYVVEKDDTIWLIANKHNLSTQDILNSNPALNEDSLLPEGQVIQLIKKEPYLNIRTQGNIVINEVIPFDVETVYDPKLKPGVNIIKDIGKDGEVEVTYSFTEQNGKLISKEQIKKEILAQPIKQIIYQGPNPSTEANPMPSSHGLGEVSGFIWPLEGTITSYYGNRRGEFHTGIDIAGGTGQPYVAAADGTVLQAAWQGNYGNMILLDHGDGVVTRYAHSLKLLVTPGQKVTKGEVIGYVGSTGRSTGPHLHFELIVNGEITNPLKYLNH